MSRASLRGQVEFALQAIDCIGDSKHEAKLTQGWKPGQAVQGIFSYGTRDTVFDRSMTLVHWIEEQYPEIKYLRELDEELITEFIGEKLETCQPNTVKALLAALRKLQEALFARDWIEQNIVPEEWDIEDNRIPRGAYTMDDAEQIITAVAERNLEYAQALRVIISCAARIDELFHLRSDKVFLNEGKVELLGKGGKTRRIRFLRPEIFDALDYSKRFIYLTPENSETWKDGLERAVRKSCDELAIQRRGVHGFRGTAACEFVHIKESLGYSEMEARRELAQWLGHNPHRTEVTYAYVTRSHQTYQTYNE
jgi:integrase